MNGGPQARVSSPTPGRSILITRAPMSASCMVQYGPDSTRVKSTTINPSSGCIRSTSADRASAAENLAELLGDRFGGADRRDAAGVTVCEFPEMLRNRREIFLVPVD